VTPTLTTSVIARLWRKINKNGPVPLHCASIGNCWVWSTGHGKKYPTINIGGRNYNAHRVAWMAHKGVWPSKFVLHKCDNKRCVRFSHLFLGTAADNVHDMQAKGRERKTPVKGMDQPNSRLTDAAVVEIRNAPMLTPARELAERFSVSKSCVIQARKGTTWKHIGEVNASNS
jgi:hypothetical protein